MMSFAFVVVLSLLICWGYRTYRYRVRLCYRVPHEDWSGL